MDNLRRLDGFIRPDGRRYSVWSIDCLGATYRLESRESGLHVMRETDKGLVPLSDEERNIVVDAVRAELRRVTGRSHSN